MPRNEREREVEHFISKNFGKKIVCPKLTDRYQEIADFEIDPNTLGPFGICIREMKVNIRAGIYTSGNVILEVNFRYDHCKRIDIEGVKDDLGGGNGYRTEVIL
jgi:hypothetical protein